ncbi:MULTISPECIES: hypothetical protein [unclassified Pseudomonas]|uniref:hypothetical protein n=1 Tax=unclassified Pseudomonas TaxID=196821 RepID=UPI0006D4834D|nr:MULTISPECIES: hypothetical protein [unclassified Pseudomonas]MCE0968982.1 hypothetical protein [Pseudomonas sp. NMI4491_12]
MVHTDDVLQTQNSPVNVGSPEADHKLATWQTGQPIPRPEIVVCDQYENYLETPPEGLEVEDAEVIWWTVASSFSREELRNKLLPVIEKRQDWACFLFSPIADLEGNGRYPSGVIQLLRDILPKGALIAVEPAAAEELPELAGTLAIQNQIWHELTWAAFRLALDQKLPDYLRDMYFAGDLGI